jgi:lipopolysaccharide export system permease protein
MEAVIAGNMRAIAAGDGDRRAALRKDALALVGVPAPRGDSAAPLVHRLTLTTLYCRALAGLTGAVLPVNLRADTVKARSGRHSYTEDTEEHRPAAAVAALNPGQLVADPGGARLRAALVGFAVRQRQLRVDAARFQVEIHKKYSLAVSCLVFVLIGAPIALRFPRGGIGLVIGASVAIFGFYYIGLIGGETLANQMRITPFWAMWTPNLVMTAGGLVLFLRLGRERGTTRGGGGLFGRLRRRAAR